MLLFFTSLVFALSIYLSFSFGGVIAGIARPQISLADVLASNPYRQAFLCGLGAKSGEPESKTARKMAQVLGVGSPPPPPPPSFIFCFSFHFSRGQNRKYLSTVFFRSETICLRADVSYFLCCTRKRSFSACNKGNRRRLQAGKNQTESYANGCYFY